MSTIYNTKIAAGVRISVHYLNNDIVETYVFVQTGCHKFMMIDDMAYNRFTDEMIDPEEYSCVAAYLALNIHEEYIAKIEKNDGKL